MRFPIRLLLLQERKGEHVEVGKRGGGGKPERKRTGRGYEGAEVGGGVVWVVRKV